ncbi:CYTH domain-containing protein [Falsibacillus albus]|uniref:CYTH domain-containing protein n=1 Tax=Falsibacillus albus TaxID=2478915 RepID=A0A3L7K291_9BACI|nr:CYTH domain-containing protein [Falsibacillus albus]RLQ97176.1 CYTH domain-containing protein [Falsibacillus albus]
MSKEIEIEFKNMLTKDEFDKINNALSLTSDDFFQQENHYFDTDDFYLKENKSALRIRVKNGKYVLTLKEPAEVGLLETHQLLNAVQVDQVIHDLNFPRGEVTNRLHEMGTDIERLQLVGSLKTNRAELPFRGGLLVMDHSSYLNKEDFELEYEVSDFQNGEEIFLEFLSDLKIPRRNTENKIQRFYKEKMRLSNNL